MGKEKQQKKKNRFPAGSPEQLDLEKLFRTIQDASELAVLAEAEHQEKILSFLRILIHLSNIQPGGAGIVLPQDPSLWRNPPKKNPSDFGPVNIGSVPVQTLRKTIEQTSNIEPGLGIYIAMLEFFQVAAEEFSADKTSFFTNLAKFVSFSKGPGVYTIREPLSYVIGRYLFAFVNLHLADKDPQLRQIRELANYIDSEGTGFEPEGVTVSKEAIPFDDGDDIRLNFTINGRKDKVSEDEWYRENIEVLQERPYWRAFRHLYPSKAACLSLFGPHSEHLPEVWAEHDFQDGDGVLVEWRIILMAEYLCLSKIEKEGESQVYAKNTIRKVIASFDLKVEKAGRGHPGVEAYEERREVPQIVEEMLEHSKVFPVKARRLTDTF